MSPHLSERQQIAARFAALLDTEVERIAHGAGGDKHFYRILTDRVCVDVHGPYYIVVNGVVCITEARALEEL